MPGELTGQSKRDRVTALGRARNDLAVASGTLRGVEHRHPATAGDALRALERVDALLEGLEREADDV